MVCTISRSANLNCVTIHTDESSTCANDKSPRIDLRADSELQMERGNNITVYNGKKIVWYAIMITTTCTLHYVYK